ncbi:MAG: hypothetical protein AAFX06_24700 [Planctomycetota bacterium]
MNVFLVRKLIGSFALLGWLGVGDAAEIHVATTDELVEAVERAQKGDSILLAAGTYRLSSPLEPGSGVSIIGKGIGQTVLTQEPDWQPSTQTLPDPETRLKGMDTRAFLIRAVDKAVGISVSHLTLTGPKLHGAIYAFGNKQLHLHHLRVEDFLASGVRTHALSESKIEECEFVDAGGRWKRGGIPGTDGGISGGAIFAVWTTDTEIAHNRFTRTQKGKADGHYGIKGRQGKRCRIHHNTIEVNFSIEFPFEGDEDMEIDHNVCFGAISIPKYAGGKVPESGRTFHIHHNYMTAGYSIEFVRNGVEIDHNLFDFSAEKDGGNLISGFGKAAAPGPALFHNNLVSNPGRGVIWINEPYDNLIVRNNHIIARTTSTPRKEGLFGFNSKSDFKTYRIIDNIIECRGLARPLFRNKESDAAMIENNQLTNVSHVGRLSNQETGRLRGLEEPLAFDCGVHGELQVDGWKATRRTPE